MIKVACAANQNVKKNLIKHKVMRAKFLPAFNEFRETYFFYCSRFYCIFNLEFVIQYKATDKLGI